MKPAIAAPGVVTWKSGCSRITSSDVTAIGIASVTQRMSAMANTPSRCEPCGVSPGGGGRTTVRIAATSARPSPRVVAVRRGGAGVRGSGGASATWLDIGDLAGHSA